MTKLTQEIYLAHQPPEIIALMNMDRLDLAGRAAKAMQLDAQGFIIDREIMLYAWDADKVMADRLTPIPGYPNGLPWGPNAFQPNLAPDTDMNKPWPRAIIYSDDAADYPALNPATPPAPAPVDAVGYDYGNGTFAVNDAAAFNHGVPVYKTGDTVQHNGVTLYYKQGWAGTGVSRIWETKAVWDAEPKS